jgi:hypothetical protein
MSAEVFELVLQTCRVYTLPIKSTGWRSFIRQRLYLSGE